MEEARTAEALVSRCSAPFVEPLVVAFAATVGASGAGG
jgi:hypothetical protein